MDETGRENQEEVEENISRCDFLTTLLSFKLYFVTLITLWKIANGGTLIFFFFFLEDASSTSGRDYLAATETSRPQ